MNPIQTHMTHEQWMQHYARKQCEQNDRIIFLLGSLRVGLYVAIVCLGVLIGLVVEL